MVPDEKKEFYWTFLSHHFIYQLGCEFSLKDLGFLHYFLHIEVKRFFDGIFLCQTKYTIDLLSCTNILDDSHLSTPIAIKPAHSWYEHKLDDKAELQSIVGAFQYLTFTWPDITHTVNKSLSTFSPTQCGTF